jgi:hypothetical protein
MVEDLKTRYDQDSLRNGLLNHLVDGAFSPEKSQIEIGEEVVDIKVGFVLNWANNPLTFSTTYPESSLYFNRERYGTYCRWLETAGFLGGNLITVTNLLLPIVQDEF